MIFTLLITFNDVIRRDRPPPPLREAPGSLARHPRRSFCRPFPLQIQIGSVGFGTIQFVLTAERVFSSFATVSATVSDRGSDLGGRTEPETPKLGLLLVRTSAHL